MYLAATVRSAVYLVLLDPVCEVLYPPYHARLHRLIPRGFA